MVKVILRFRPAVDVLMRRRSTGRVERMRHRLAGSAIGIEAREGRDSLARLGAQHESPALEGGSPFPGNSFGAFRFRVPFSD